MLKECCIVLKASGSQKVFKDGGNFVHYEVRLFSRLQFLQNFLPCRKGEVLLTRECNISFLFLTAFCVG